MSHLDFNRSERPTLGVEIELALVDAETMELKSVSPQIREQLPEELTKTVKAELMQCYIEINTGICNTVAEAEADLTGQLRKVQDIADGLDTRLYWSGTHPFSHWESQLVTDDKRYHGLVEMMQDTARQLVTFGLHVHVGVDTGDKAVMICDRILNHLPTLLALSANSPFWEGRITGLQSWRSRVMDGLPTAGLPPLMRNWSEYVWLVNHLVETQYIQSIRELWWDVRPHHNFGTVEVRICDVPGNLRDAMGIAALVQCLIKALSDEVDEGMYQHDCHPMMARQNKWRAARLGLEAQLVESRNYKMHSARSAVRELYRLLKSTAQHLDCTEYLDHLLDQLEQPNWSQRQIDILEETGDPAELVRRMVQQSRV